MKKRRSPQQKAIEARIAKGIAEVRKLHPRLPREKIVVSFSGNNLVLNPVGIDAGYRDTLADTNPVEAAFASPGRSV